MKKQRVQLLYKITQLQLELKNTNGEHLEQNCQRILINLNSDTDPSALDDVKDDLNYEELMKEFEEDIDILETIPTVVCLIL